MSTEKEDVNLVMAVLDELVEQGYHIIRDPTIRRSDSWTDGWGGKGGTGKKLVVNFALSITKPSRDEVKKRVSEAVSDFQEGML